MSRRRLRLRSRRCRFRSAFVPIDACRTTGISVRLHGGVCARNPLGTVRPLRGINRSTTGGKRRGRIHNDDRGSRWRRRRILRCHSGLRDRVRLFEKKLCIASAEEDCRRTDGCESKQCVLHRHLPPYRDSLRSTSSSKRAIPVPLPVRRTAQKIDRSVQKDESGRGQECSVLPTGTSGESFANRLLACSFFT